MKQLLIICGPTATGKTNQAQKLAQKFNGELINADSRQFYQGMDIGTGKDLPPGAVFYNRGRQLGLKSTQFKTGFYLLEDEIPLWLLDVVDPSYQFNVADYLRLAVPVIEDIWSRGKLPILVGGSGFYLQALVGGVDTVNIPPDLKLRSRLEKLSLPDLQKRLTKDNPTKFSLMNNSDQNNPRRLIRAIEVANYDQLRNQSPASLKNENVDCLWLGLKLANPLLDKKINQRVRQRLEKGLLLEIKSLLAKGYSFDNSLLGQTLGYSDWQQYFTSSQKDQKTYQQAVSSWQTAEHQYARRQMTWFNKNKAIVWFDADDVCLFGKIAKKVDKWYINNDGQKG